MSVVNSTLAPILTTTSNITNDSIGGMFCHILETFVHIFIDYENSLGKIIVVPKACQLHAANMSHLWAKGLFKELSKSDNTQDLYVVHKLNRNQGSCFWAIQYEQFRK